MSKKHFEALTNALAATRPPSGNETEYRQWAQDVEQVARVCGAQNGLFDHGRFTAACRER